MNRIDRLQAILTTLQSKRVVKAEELATRFEVSLRTIYRDIRSLEAGGVPIGAEAGVGYFLIDGYHLPPVMFTQEEARSLLLGGKIVAEFTDKQTATNFNSALTKVRAVLDMDKKEELEGLEKDILINPFPSSKPEASQEELHINEIKAALASSKVIEFDYYSGGKGEHTKRSVEPMGLCYYFNQWHLIAFCQLRQDYRDFRLDRIAKLSVLSKSYARYKHLNIKEYMDKLVQDTELESCIISIDKKYHRYLENYKYEMGLVREEKKGDRVEMHFTTYSLYYFANWLLMMGDSVEIVSPEKLNEIMKKSIQTLNDKYNL